MFNNIKEKEALPTSVQQQQQIYSINKKSIQSTKESV